MNGVELLVKKSDEIGANPIWITEQQVVSQLNLSQAMDTLERTLLSEAQGKAKNLSKTHLMIAKNDAMHALGASVSDAGLCGFKTWINVRGKSETIVSLFSTRDGSLKAIIEATALGQLRTAAMTGVGTKYLAHRSADDMVVIGTGKQALPQIAACHIARPLKRLRIFSRNPKNRAKLQNCIQDRFDFDVINSASLEEAIEGVGIITLITNSTEPFLTSKMIIASAHINAMGAIVPVRVEFTTDIFPRCTIVAVDNIQNVKNLSSEFSNYYGKENNSWSDVKTIGQIIAEGTIRSEDSDLTLFKATGMGLSDLSIAIEIYHRVIGSKETHKTPERIKFQPILK